MTELFTAEFGMMGLAALVLFLVLVGLKSTMDQLQNHIMHRAPHQKD